jgi:hypothetical protein
VREEAALSEVFDTLLDGVVITSRAMFDYCSHQRCRLTLDKLERWLDRELN